MGRVGDLIDLFRKVDRLLQLEEKHGKAIQTLQAEHAALKDRVAALEAREGMLVVEAKAAAQTAAGLVTQQGMSDLSRRLGRMEHAMDARMRLLGPEQASSLALPTPKARSRKKPNE